MNEAKILAIKADLKRRAAEKFPGYQQRQNAYVWGTIRRIKERHHA